MQVPDNFPEAVTSSNTLNMRKWAMGYSTQKIFGTPSKRTWEIAGMSSKNQIISAYVPPIKVIGKHFTWYVRAVFKFKNNDFPIIIVKDDTTWYGYHDRQQACNAVIKCDTLEKLMDKIDGDLKALKRNVNDEKAAINMRIAEQVAFIKSKFGEEFEVDTDKGWRSDYTIFIKGSLNSANITLMGKEGETGEFIHLHGLGGHGIELDDVMISHIAEVLKRSALKAKMSAVE